MRFGSRTRRKKVCLIIDREPYRYQAFVSDIGGQDVRAHSDDVGEALRVVRDWLATCLKEERLPGGEVIFRRYELFRSELPSLCVTAKLDVGRLIYSDYVNFVVEWLRNNPR